MGDTGEPVQVGTEHDALFPKSTCLTIEEIRNQNGCTHRQLAAADHLNEDNTLKVVCSASLSAMTRLLLSSRPKASVQLTTSRRVSVISVKDAPLRYVNTAPVRSMMMALACW